MTIKTITALFITFSIISCKPDYTYNVNYDGDKLVVNAIMEGNVGITVALSKSQSPAGIIPDTGFNVKNGRVWLYQNDTLVAEMTRNAVGKFTISGFKPQARKSYRLKAVAKDLDTVESLPVIMPSLPSVTSYVMKKDNSYAVNQSRGAAVLLVDLKSNPDEKKYYDINSYIQVSPDSTNSFFSGFIGSLGTCGLNYSIFSDECFNNNSLSFGIFEEHNDKGVWIFELISIDRNFFDYERKQEQPKGLYLGFVEPTLAVSNMKNGYGIFAAKNTRKFSLKLD